MKNLLLQSLAGLFFLLVVLALALFVAAGTGRFWQAQLYLGVFAACALGITFYLLKCDPSLLERRLQAGPIAETQKSQKWIQGASSLLFIALFLVAGFDRRFHWSHIPPVVSLFSTITVAAGFLVVLLVFRENSYTSAVIEVAEEQKVIATGPYRVVRHPMYAGAMLLLVFTPLALGSWVALLLSLALLAVIAVRALEEEKFLAAHLEGYDAYCRAVRHRLIPFLW